MMMRGAGDLDWSRIEESVPAFLTMATMAFTFNIAHGVSFGVISHVLIHVLSGRFSEINPAMIVVAGVLSVYLGFYL